MANVKILLLKPLKHLGGEGDVATVKAGYARNFLLPNKLAMVFNHANSKQVESLRKARMIREAKELEGAQDLANHLQSISLTIPMRTGDEGKLFGSVSASELKKRFHENGIDIEKSCIRLAEPIKVLGKHKFSVRLHKDVSVELFVEVVSENPIND